MAKQANAAPKKPALPPADALYQALSLCRKAGKLIMGFDAVEEAVYKGKAWLVLTAADVSPKTVARMQRNAGDLVEIRAMPLTMDRLAPLSTRQMGVCAVTDRNLAQLCLSRLDACGAINDEEERSE